MVVEEVFSTFPSGVTIFSLTEEATVDGHLKHKFLATGMEAGGLFCFVNT